MSMVTKGFVARDQQRFFNKLKNQLRVAITLTNPEERQQQVHTIARKLFKHLHTTAQSHEDPLQLVWTIAKSLNIDPNSPQGRAIRALMPVGAHAVSGGLVGSTKG